MPVEFLTDAEAAESGRFTGPPAQAELEKVFVLDDADRELIGRRRGPHMKLGFALQLTTVRYLGVFLEDPLDVPGVVLDYLAEQLEIEDPSCVKRYTERRTTPFDHVTEIKDVCGLKNFETAEAELRDWIEARVWMTGDGPKAIFTDAITWLRERDVLLPGVSVLARMVRSIRRESNERLWDVLCQSLSDRRRHVLETLLHVPEGKRVSDLERWRKGPVKSTGRAMVEALERVAEINSVGIARVDLDSVPDRRLVELDRYEMAGKATFLRRHGTAGSPRRASLRVWLLPIPWISLISRRDLPARRSAIARSRSSANEVFIFEQ